MHHLSRLRVSRSSVLIAALGLAALFVAACGGGDDKKSDATASATGTTAQRTAGATVAGSTPTTSKTAAPTGTQTAPPAVAGALAVLTAVAAGQNVPVPTVAAARTVIALATQAPPPTSAPGATASAGAGSTPSANTTSAPSAVAKLSIDADATNGGGACASIDASRAVSKGDDFQVAICLESSDKEPINGKLVTITLAMAYSPILAGVDRAGDGVSDLNGNPDFNEGAATGGTDWDCNIIDEPRAAPRTTPGPALIICITDDVQDNNLAGGTVALATVTLHAAESGTAQLSLGGSSQETALLSGAIEFLCSSGTNRIDCGSATVEVR